MLYITFYPEVYSKEVQWDRIVGRGDEGPDWLVQQIKKLAWTFWV